MLVQVLGSSEASSRRAPKESEEGNIGMSGASSYFDPGAGATSGLPVHLPETPSSSPLFSSGLATTPQPPAAPCCWPCPTAAPAATATARRGSAPSIFNPGSSTTTLPAPCGTSSAGCGRGVGCCARPLVMAMATAIGNPTPTPTFTPHAPRNTTVIV